MATIGARPGEDGGGHGPPVGDGTLERAAPPLRRELRLEGVDQVGLRRIGRDEAAHDVSEGGIGHSRPFEAAARLRQTPQLGQHAGHRAVRARSGDHRLEGRHTGVGERPRGDRRREAWGRADEGAEEAKPGDDRLPR